MINKNSHLFAIVKNAFNKAIKEKRLSDNTEKDNYAGNYMYMGTENNKDYFKNSLTREYLQ